MAAILIVGVAALAVLAFHYWEQLFEADGPARLRRFLGWSCKGLLVPVVVWFIINSGIVPGMPILVRDIALARSRGGNWLRLLVESSAPVLFLVVSWWTAVTLGWLLHEIAARTRQRAEFNRECLFWCAILVPVPFVVFFLTGTWGLGLAVLAWLAPVVHFTLPMAETKKAAPMYARAIAKVKFGKYGDAEAEVLEQLERHQDDFAGWMMLAELYANQFNDLPEADRTVRELCRQPNVNPVQISLALHRLADWHLKRADDPLSARAALEEICRILPGSHLDRMARLRIDQLPATREELLEQRKPKILRLPALSEERVGAPTELRSSELLQAKSEAERCVERLKRNPNDPGTREKFAILLAEQLGEPGLAIEQLELLLELPDQPTSKLVEWLAMIGAWQLRYQGDTEAGRKTLERLVSEYPGTTQAMAARRRLDLLEMESAARTGADSKRPPQGPIKLAQFQN